MMTTLQLLDAPSPRRPMDCPVEDWLSFLGHRWNALVLWHLKETARRPAELASLLPGISDKVLSERLEGLRARGLITRQQADGFPRRIHYALTARGRDLIRILDALELWSRQ